jgi:hypothetical protein
MPIRAMPLEGITRNLSVDKALGDQFDHSDEADRLHHEYPLQKISDTLSWLNSQLMTPENWEEGTRDH